MCVCVCVCVRVCDLYTSVKGEGVRSEFLLLHHREREVPFNVDFGIVPLVSDR